MTSSALGCVLFVAAALTLQEVRSQDWPQWEEVSGDARWCSRRSDGVHADALALPPCSGYFQCWRGKLLRLDVCPRGLCFNAQRQICLEPEHCGCPMPTRPQLMHGGTPGPPARGVSLEKEFWGFMPWAGQSHLRLRRMLRRVANPSQNQQTDASQWNGPQVLMSAEAGSQMDYYNITKWPQVNALLAFQARVFSVRNDVLSNWKVPSNSTNPLFVCKWTGVSCANGNIISLSLVNQGDPLWAVLTPPPNSVSGDTWRVQSIPPEFGDLTALTELDLSNNGNLDAEDGSGLQRMRGLEGPIPSEIGRITNLQKLNLAGNAFSGPIPEALGLLTKLADLQLGTNKLEGDIPESLCNLANLTLLDINNNGINGSIPSCISALRGLNSLSLLWLPLTGTLPESLGKMTNLSIIEINTVTIGGSIPDSLSKLTGLTTLTFDDTNITGVLPLDPWWQGLLSLSYVTISDSPITGRLPGAMGPAVTSVDFSGSNLTQGLPESLVQNLCNSSKPIGLNGLYLSGVPLGGRLPSALSSCVNLAYMYLTGSGFEGELPLGFLDKVGPKLVKFDIGGNRLTGQLGASAMLKMPGATHFNVSGNEFVGQAPTLICTQFLNVFEIGRNKFEGDIGRVLGSGAGDCIYPDLTIDLSSNQLTGKLPSNWLRGGMRFSIANNSITGAIPPVMPKNCANLSYLDLSNNRFHRSIPASLINKCPNMAQLRLSNNSLSGPVPTAEAPGSGVRMQGLQLSGNLLSGSIPTGLSNLPGLRELDLSANNLSGPVLAGIGDMALLMALDLSSNHLTQSIPGTLGSLAAITRLSLANNSLSGPIPLQLAPPFLSNLSELDLSNNKLSGPIPYGFSQPKVYGMSLNLSYNNLSGQVPGDSSGPLGANPLAVSGNPSLCGGAGYPDCPVEVQQTQGLTGGQVAGIVMGVLAFFAIVAGVLGWWIDRRRSEWERGALLVFKEFDPPLTTRVLVRATNNFSDEFLLGRGGFGSVYKAELPDGTVVAIKRLTIGSVQGEEEFKSEVQVLGSLSHKNIVKLTAAYVARAPSTERLLIYEYLSGGSLDQIIVPAMDKSSPFCSFPVRRQVALDVARGLKYLHHDCSPGIIHRDMKPANVLIGSDLVGRVADFGLATSIDPERSHQTLESICGTAGYVAPEYHTLNRVSFKSDVYAYGVTLIQIMTGRRSTDEDIVEKGLSRWASSGSSIIDPNMNVADEGEESLILGCIKIGVLCAAKLPCDRPSMKNVVQLLQDLESFVASIKNQQP